MAVRRFPDLSRPDPEGIQCAVDALRAGGIVVMPTDTVYGLAALPDHSSRLFEAKGRPPEKQIPWLIAGADQAPVKLSGMARSLADRFWPGALTLVVPTTDGSIGLRVPAHPVALALLRAVGKPLAVTSANVSGEAPGLTAEDAAKDLLLPPDEILDAGTAPGGEASTVVRVDENELTLLRAGAIPFDRLL